MWIGFKWAQYARSMAFKDRSISSNRVGEGLRAVLNADHKIRGGVAVRRLWLGQEEEPEGFEVPILLARCQEKYPWYFS